jgi:predicted permease
MKVLLDDLRFAMRLLISGRTVSVLAILTLALGIGANTAMFSFLNFAFLRRAPAGDPTQLVWIGSGPRQEPFGQVSAPHFRQLQPARASLTSVMAYAGTEVSIGGGLPERALALVVSGNYFDVLQIRPSLGRTFAADEDSVAGARAVVVISHELWTRRFAQSTSVVGTAMIVNGKPFTIIGVAPPGFVGVDIAEPIVAWVPLAMLASVSPDRSGALTDPASRFLKVVGRFATGASIAQVRAAADVFSAQLNADGVRPDDRIDLSVKPLIGTLDPGSRQDVTQIFLLLGIVPAFVLLIACANAANMQLARGLSRRRELAVRRAIGATRGRLIRQLLTESVLLATIAGAVGVLFAYWLIRAITGLAALPASFIDALRIEPNVLLATLALSVASGVAFGLVPAFSATNADLTPALKDEGLALGSGPSRFRVRNLLIVAQVVVSMVLLATAGLFLRSLDRSMSVDPGFNSHNTLATTLDLRALEYTADARAALIGDVLARAGALPGATGVAFASVLPLSGNRATLPMAREGAGIQPETPPIHFTAVTPGYFETMGIVRIDGRTFTESDRAQSAPVAVIDQRMAERFWPGENALGKRLRVGSDTSALREVVGITGTVVTGALTDRPDGYVFLPLAQVPQSDSPVSLVVRTSAAPASLIPSIRTLFREVNPNLPLEDLMTYDAMLIRATDGQRAVASVLGVLGVLALTLAGLGMYGITSHGVTMRTREIGIRMSLGARRAEIQRMFVTDGVRLTLIGVAIGLLLSVGLAKLLSSLLFGLGATDAGTFVTAAVVLCAVAALASFIPARRAAKLDPLVALRSS